MITNCKNNISGLKNTFYKIFRNNNPFGQMFESHIKHKIILCPIDGYCLTESQFFALIKTAKSFGETSFYFSEIESKCFENKNIDICTHNNCYRKFSIETPYEEYCKVPTVLENALYSINATWGIIISHEDHAVLGGTNDFVSLFKKNYTEWPQGINNFIELWKSNKELYGSDTTWIPDFLKYINE